MTYPFEEDVREALRLKSTHVPEEAVQRLRSTDYEPSTGRRCHVVWCVATELARTLRRLRSGSR